jgi:hypothetical protein
VAPPDEKRIKFCRYCDGVIEWGTEVCPHCGETLKVTEVDDLDFVTGPAAGAAPPKPAPDPAPAEETAEESEDEDEPETIEFEALDVPPETTEMPTLAPVSESPPVVKPIPAGPPVVKPIGKKGRPPVVKPIGKKGGPPVVKPIGKKGGPPVMKPVAPPPEQAPVLQPVGGATPPPAPVPVEDCPLCGEPMQLRGGACRHCQVVVCVPCQMRANGMRAGRAMEMNKVRWSDRARRLTPDGILCPQCGKKGVELP